MGTDKLVFKGEQWGATRSDTVCIIDRKWPDEALSGSHLTVSLNFVSVLCFPVFFSRTFFPNCFPYFTVLFSRIFFPVFFYIFFQYLFSFCEYGCCCCYYCCHISQRSSSSHTHRRKISTGNKYKKIRGKNTGENIRERKYGEIRWNTENNSGKK